MAGRRVIQSFRFWAGIVLTGSMLWAGIVLAAAAAAVPGPDLRHPAVTLTAKATVGAWAVAAAAMLVVRPGEWRATAPRLRFARLVWTLGLAMLFVHMTVAFWLAHQWSHAAAVRHVESVGGVGEGIVVNYLFAAVWAGDVAWWWANPAGYAARLRRIGYAVHGFLAFVTFNATVVFGPAELRVVYGVLFGGLAVLWWKRAAVRPALDIPGSVEEC